MAHLTEVGNDMWRAVQDVRVGPGFYLPSHMTVIRHPDTTLFVHSPVELGAAAISELGALGEVRDIVAPNLFHHRWFGEAARLYPRARCHAPSGLSSKNSALPEFTPLSEEQQPLAPALETYLLPGVPGIDEFVFYHPRSKSLLLTDLAFNMNGTKGFLTPLILSLAGTRHGLCCSRLFKTQISDKRAFAQALRGILTLNFEQVLPAHGEPVTENAKARLEQACQRLLS